VRVARRVRGRRAVRGGWEVRGGVKRVLNPSTRRLFAQLNVVPSSRAPHHRLLGKGGIEAHSHAATNPISVSAAIRYR
jgi:hypothetical protein